jgi:hypothetical protein
MIALDSTRSSTVVTCTRCPWWAGAGDSRAQGRLIGAAHERRAHPGDDQANDTLRHWKARNTP